MAVASPKMNSLQSNIAPPNIAPRWKSALPKRLLSRFLPKTLLTRLLIQNTAMHKLASVIAITAVMTGCVTHTVRVVDMTPPQQSAQILAEDELLDVGVTVFDANVPEEYDDRIEQIILPEVRRAETQYIPYFAKNLLQSTGNWGAVRVVPRATHAVDVTLSGKIIASNGESMEIEVVVADATGTTWFTKSYSALASKYAYEDSMPAHVDAFQTIYKEMADDMLAHRESLDAEDIQRIRATAELKFAREFSADAFSEHVREVDTNKFEIVRLPADNDPMLERVRRVREREYLFIDTLDDYYANFHRQMFPSYQGWRKASYEGAIAYNELKAKERANKIGGVAAIAGGVASIYGSDNAYVDAGGVVGVIAGARLLTTSIQKRHEAEQQAERLRELGTAAEAELIPTTIDLENQTTRLQGSVEEQYKELRRILRRVYFEDLGMAPPNEEELTIVDGSEKDEESSNEP